MMTSVQNSSSLSHAIHWWHRRLTQAPRQKAERLRNDLLQEIFVLRRSFELAYRAQEGLTREQLQKGIEELTRLHQQVATLSDELAPPQLDDLAIAIQQLLLRWQQQYSQSGETVRYQGEFDAMSGNPRFNEVVLLALEAWLQVVETLAPVHLQVSLHSVHRDVSPGNTVPRETAPREVELSLKASFAADDLCLPSSVLYELNYLAQIFGQLTQGEYLQWLPERLPEPVLQGLFRWREPTSMEPEA